MESSNDTHQLSPVGPHLNHYLLTYPQEFPLEGEFILGQPCLCY